MSKSRIAVANCLACRKAFWISAFVHDDTLERAFGLPNNTAETLLQDLGRFIE
jgi:hypothetical protein